MLDDFTDRPPIGRCLEVPLSVGQLLGLGNDLVAHGGEVFHQSVALLFRDGLAAWNSRHEDQYYDCSCNDTAYVSSLRARVPPNSEPEPGTQNRSYNEPP